MLTQWWLLYVLFLYLTGRHPTRTSWRAAKGLRHAWGVGGAGVGKLAARILVMAIPQPSSCILARNRARGCDTSVIHPEIFGLTALRAAVAWVAVFLLVANTC